LKNLISTLIPQREYALRYHGRLPPQEPRQRSSCHRTLACAAELRRAGDCMPS